MKDSLKEANTPSVSETTPLVRLMKKINIGFEVIALL